MRVKQPEPFDPNREYNPGERCVYRGMVLIAEIWTAADARLANNNPAIFTQRCVRCKIQREAERKTGIKNITITRCCKGVYKTAGGYVWEYNLTAKEV